MTHLGSISSHHHTNPQQKSVNKPITQIAKETQKKSHLKDDLVMNSSRRGNLSMKPIVFGTLASTATAVVMGATLNIYKPGGFGPVGSALTTAALFSASSAVSSSAAYADNAAQGIIGSAAVGALNGLVMGACSGQVVDVTLNKSLMRAASFALVGAVSATVGAITSRAIGGEIVSR